MSDDERHTSDATGRWTMPHVDQDRLVLLAVSRDLEDSDVADHLTQCDGCRHEMRTLRHVAGLGAAARGLQNLPPPPERIWQAVEAGIARTPVAGPAGRRGRLRWLAPVLAAAAAAVVAAAVAGRAAVERITVPRRTLSG